MEINYCNMKIRTINFSRNIVLIFAVIIWQSSLGTNAIQSSGQSFGQNSYIKFNNGLLIQWGVKAGAVGFSSLYLPTSFYDTNYIVQLTGVSANTTEIIVYAPTIYTKTVSSFKVGTRYIASGGEIAWTGWQFTWFAIGKWK
jgi:hypothetical protein